MLRRPCFVPIVLFLLVVFVGQALALNVQDVYPDDESIILSQAYGTGGPPSGEYFVYEDYNEQYLIPYPSHDGMGIVNAEGQYFDKVVTIDRQADIGQFILHFNVTNTTNYLWSDYHIEFWDAEFMNRLPIPFMGTPYDGYLDVMYWDWDGDEEDEAVPVWVDPFMNMAVSPDGSMVSWWAPKEISWDYPPPGSPMIITPGGQEPGETNWFILPVDLNLLPDTFGIRQVATTTPEPATLALFGLGLAGLIGLRRRSR